MPRIITIIGMMLVGGMLVVAGIGAGGIGPADASGAQNGSNHPVTVGASGQAQAQPDKVVVRLEVEALADDPRDARTQVADNVTKMRSALTDIGLEESQIRTVDFNIYEDRIRPRKPNERPETAYRASHGIVIELDDIDDVGGVIDVAVNNGASNIHDVQFTLSEETRSELRREALQDAMANARGQAETIASSANLRLTDVDSVSTQDVRFPGPRHEALAAAGDGGGGGTALNSGPVTVSATVSVTYNATT